MKNGGVVFEQSMNIPFIGKLDHHMQEVVRGASFALVIRVLGTVLGFGVSVMVARLLAAEGAGLYFLALSAISIAATLGRVGLDNAVVRFVASRAVAGEWRGVQGVRKLALGIAGGVSLVMAISLFVGAPWLAGSIFEKPGLQMPFMIGALAVVPFSLAMIQAEALRGIKNIVASQWIKTVLISLGCLILLYPFASEWGVEGAVAAYVLSAGLTFMIAAYLWRKSMSALAQDADGTGHSTREVLASSWLLYGVALSGLVIQQAATVLLGVWGSSADVGVFVVARRIASLLLFPLMSMISILAPKFSMMTREKDMDGLARLARQSSMLLIAFSLPAALFVYLGSEWILGWFGPEFVEGSAVLGILLIGVVVNAATGPVGNILMMCGYERLVRQVSLISAGILVLGCTVFIPMLGAIGAAGASSIAVAIMNLYMTIMVRRELGFWPVGVHRL